MPKRLTLVIHAMTGGGAERTLAAMANHWAAAGDRVTLITLASPEQDAYELSADVRRASLAEMRESANLWQAIRNNLRRLIRLRRAIRDAESEVVISFTDQMNILTLLACVGLRRRVIICERVDPRRHKIGRSWSWLRRHTYRWCDTLVVQTTDVRDYFRRFMPNGKIRVIANAVHELPDSQPTPLARKPWILAIGRLEIQKGFDLLIEAFAKIAGRHPDWKLKILGDGSQRDSLSEQIRALGLEHAVELCGWVATPTTWICQAELFVLSSRYEGFPNALLEAMATGVSAVSFDCESGPAEIIRHEIDGLLVPPEDVEQLGRAIARLIENTPERIACGERAREVAQRFSRQRFFQDWEAALQRQPDASACEREA